MFCNTKVNSQLFMYIVIPLAQVVLIGPITKQTHTSSISELTDDIYRHGQHHRHSQKWHLQVFTNMSVIFLQIILQTVPDTHNIVTDMTL